MKDMIFIQSGDFKIYGTLILKRHSGPTHTRNGTWVVEVIPVWNYQFIQAKLASFYKALML